MVPQIGCAQLNLRRSHNAKRHFDLNQSKVQFLQEPPLNHRESHALSRTGYTVYCGEPRRGEGPRAALRVSREVVSSALPAFTDRDRAAAVVRVGDKEMVVVSQYCHQDDPAVPVGLERVVTHCRDNRIPLIVGADTNAWSNLWGPDQNPRGEVFEEFVDRYGLRVLNDGLKPTFYSMVDGGETQTYIDVTLVNTFALGLQVGGDWQVGDKEPFTDHAMITFNATATPQPPRLTRNLKKVDWPAFRGEVEARVLARGPGLDLHEKAALLTEAVTQSLDRQAPLS